MSIPRFLHYPGAKWSMPWIVDYFPLGYEQMTYLEICVGSGATLFQKRPSVLETINDLDDNVINLFKMIRSRGKELAELVRFTPYAREEYSQSYESGGEMTWRELDVFLSDAGWLLEQSQAIVQVGAV